MIQFISMHVHTISVEYSLDLDLIYNAKIIMIVIMKNYMIIKSNMRGECIK